MFVFYRLNSWTIMQGKIIYKCICWFMQKIYFKKILIWSLKQNKNSRISWIRLDLRQLREKIIKKIKKYIFSSKFNKECIR